VIATPIAWFVMNKFLQNFEYRVEIGPWIFVAGFAATIIVALVTVGYRSIKSAVANPATSLRSE